MKRIVFLICLYALVSAIEVSAAVLFYDDCEDAPNTIVDWVLSGVGPSLPNDQSQILVSYEQARSGSSSYKFILPPYGTDGTSSPSKRTELRLAGLSSPELINNFEYGKEYWIGYSVFFPSNFIFPDTGTAGNWGLTGQFHSVDDACDTMILNPTCALYYESPSGMYLTIRGDDSECSTTTLDRNSFFMGSSGVTINVGEWNDFVINVKWGYTLTQSPKFKLWVNDVLEIDDSGINCWYDSKGPYWKIGLYAIQDNWLTIYIDEIKVGNSSAVYADVAPSGNPSAPTALSISTTTLGVWTQGSEASGTLVATGGTPPYTWAQTGAPAGFSLTASTGAWSITPTEAQAQIGQYDISVTCTDDDGNQATKQFSGTITATSTPTTPTVTSFELPATASTMTIPVTTFTGSASTAAYIITESASKPTAGATGWTATAPSSIIATVAGSVDFWAYVKDADGIVSSGSVETVTITISEQVVSGWTETATPNVWQATLATIEPLRLTLDGADGTLKALLDDVSATGDWFFASDNIIYTYSVTDPDNAYTEIKAFTDSEPDSVTPAEAVLQVGGDKTINIGGKRIDVR